MVGPQISDWVSPVDDRLNGPPGSLRRLHLGHEKEGASEWAALRFGVDGWLVVGTWIGSIPHFAVIAKVDE